MGHVQVRKLLVITRPGSCVRHRERWGDAMDQHRPIGRELGATSCIRHICGDTSYWVNYNDLTTTSLEIMVSKGNHPQMALIQVSEIL